MPLVSIIIPSYNSAEFLPQTLASALGQTESSVEVILVDDGSTDASPEIARSFGDKIRVYSQANSGVSAARNLGASVARGEWLLFLDSDDQLLPHAVSALLKKATDTSAGVVYGMVIERAAPPKEPRLNGFNYAEGQPPVPAKRNYARSVIITPGSALVRKSLHEKVGGFVPTFEPMEDRDYWIKCGFIESAWFVDTVVLDKTWRPFSAGRQNAKRIWNGLRSRLRLAEWCEKASVDLAGLPTDRRTLLESALKEAVWFQTTEILPQLLDESQRAGVSLRWTLRARVALLGKKNEPPPDWLIPLS